jgi:hypothetical protein
VGEVKAWIYEHLDRDHIFVVGQSSGSGFGRLSRDRLEMVEQYEDMYLQLRLGTHP